jgi:hypothetical protein
MLPVPEGRRVIQTLPMKRTTNASGNRNVCVTVGLLPRQCSVSIKVFPFSEATPVTRWIRTASRHWSSRPALSTHSSS